MSRQVTASHEEGLWDVWWASKVLNVCEGTIYRLVKRGKLPCVRVGNRLRFRTSDLKNWMSENTTENQPQWLVAKSMSSDLKGSL